jgi:hypothetical protein
MPEDRRAVLEAIAFGSDREVKPVDRLRALELLRELDGEPEPELRDHDLSGMSGEVLDAHLDALCGSEIVRDALAGGGRWPIMAAAIYTEIDRQIGEHNRNMVERCPTDMPDTIGGV